MSEKHTPMVVAAARVLCRRGAEQCCVDFEDSWKLYGEDYLEDARQALDAAGVPELLEVLVDVMFRHVPFSDKSAYAEKARAAIAKATGEQP